VNRVLDELEDEREHGIWTKNPDKNPDRNIDNNLTDNKAESR
jgi:hypothetical protein